MKLILDENLPPRWREYLAPFGITATHWIDLGNIGELSAIAIVPNPHYAPFVKLEIEVPDSAFSALRQAPKEFTACLRLMAAAKLYEIGHLSQELAAELAGQCRQEFLVSLSRLGISPFQGVEDDLATLDLLT